MKKQLLTLLGFCFISLTFLAQNKANLIIFSEDGDKFYAFVNGIKQNNNPESNVKVTGLSPNIALRIEFEDKALPQLKQNMVLDGGLEHTAKIKRDMKKQMKLQYFGSVPLAESSTGMATVAYHTSADPEPEPVHVASGNNANTVTSGNVNTTVTSKTITSKNSNPKTNENVSINVNMAGVGINMNVNGMEPQMGTDVTTTTSSTVTTTHSSGGSYNSTHTEPAPAKAQASTAPVTKAGCSVAASPANFAKMKQNVESKPFSDTKMSTAKIATKSNCLSVDQVKEICKLFSMDDDKLAYAKFAYDYCVDKANYYEVSEVFSFSSTTDEFNKFLEK